MHSIHRLLGNGANSSAWENCFMCSRRRRRSTNHWAVAKLACVLFLASSVRLAQRVVTATANVPFDFWSEGQKFAAGGYTFDTGFPAWHSPDNGTPCRDLPFPEINSVIVLSLLNLTNAINPRIGANHGSRCSHQRDRD